MTDTDTRPPHRWVADKIGFSVAGVSLLRSGNRLPSFEVMRVIEREFGWPMADQLDHRENDDYAAKFEQVVTDKYTETK